MSDKMSSGKNRVVPLVIGFIILFVVTFSLGIIVGKGISQRSFKSLEITGTVPSEPVAPENYAVREYEEFQAVREEYPAKPPISREPSEEIIKEESEDEAYVEIPSQAEPPPQEIAEIPVEPEPVPQKPIPTPEPKREIQKAAIEEPSKTDQNKREGRVKLPPIDPKGSYTVQIGSFTDKKAAESILSSMKRKGYPAFISSMTDSNRKRWYRVRIGTFQSSQIADEYGESLKVLEPEVKIVFITLNK